MNAPGGVVVVGNGPVGQTTALLLARWGVPVLLLDARPARDAVGSKAICQQRDVLDVWACVGGSAIAAEGLTWTTARTFYRGAELHSWSFVDNGASPLPPFVNIGQDRTEAILDDLIARQDLIDVRWSHEVTGLSQSADGVIVTCATASGPLEIAADHVVVAAGARAGALRDALGVRFDGESFDDRFLICDIRADLPGWERERRFYFDPPWNPDRQVLIHPCPGGTFRIDWQVPADFDLVAEEAYGGLDERIRDIIGAVPYEVVWKTVYRFHSRLADRMRVGRVLLAGDAAHLVAPFGARGLNSGVADAENAAWKLAAVLHGWAPSSLLETYHRERHAAAVENLEITTATMRFLVPPDAEGWSRRRALLEAARTDPERRAEIDSGRFAEPFWYVDSPLTTPDPTRPFAGRPLRGHAPPAGPGVLVPDVPVTDPARPAVSRFRELVRDGVLVMVADAFEAADLAGSLDAAIVAPTRVLAAGALGGGDRVLTALGARPGEAWVIRPDGHVAAVVPALPTAVTSAVSRALGGVSA
ncbi:MAG TPA: FAD-dependent monooxygenase [Sporichthya sp.]|nr:FAD-dependent monooxygenase [Sporichthya sp.]